MSPSDRATVLEVLKSVRTELNALVHDDIHVPTGPLLEQLVEAIQICEVDPDG